MKKVNDFYSYDETKLNQSFQKSCSDKDFVKFVSRFKVKEDILKKYTSLLEESFSEWKNCENCPGLEHCPNAVEGYCYLPVVEKNILNFSYITCPKLEKKKKENAYKEKLSLLDMPKEFRDACFQNIYKDDKARVPILHYFKEFMEQYKNEEKPKGIYLNGSFGSGKTYLIAALFHEMAKKGVSSVMVYYPEFLRNLKSSFQTTYSEQFEQIQKTPLLLLDDIGAENVSNWSRDEVLGPILQYRMENHLPTFFTSNLTLEELENALSTTSSGVDKVKAKRIIERVKQLTVSLELVSKNRRD